MIESTNCVISFENTETKEVQTITSKDAIVSDISIDQDNTTFGSYYSNSSSKPVHVPTQPSPVTVTFTLKVLDENFMHEFFGGGFKPKLRNKKVDDCTIQELLYAVRQKVNKK